MFVAKGGEALMTLKSSVVGLRQAPGNPMTLQWCSPGALAQAVRLGSGSEMRLERVQGRGKASCCGAKVQVWI